jgi:hypothetical protein
MKVLEYGRDNLKELIERPGLDYGEIREYVEAIINEKEAD